MTIQWESTDLFIKPHKLTIHPEESQVPTAFHAVCKCIFQIH